MFRPTVTNAVNEWKFPKKLPATESRRRLTLKRIALQRLDDWRNIAIPLIDDISHDDISHAATARKTWVRISQPFRLLRGRPLVRPRQLNRHVRNENVQGWPSAVPRCSVENRIGPAFL